MRPVNTMIVAAMLVIFAVTVSGVLGYIGPVLILAALAAASFWVSER